MEEKEILNEVNGSGKDKVRRILIYVYRLGLERGSACMRDNAYKQGDEA